MLNFETLKSILLWVSPVVFLEGLILLFFKPDHYSKLEVALGKEMGIKKRMIPALETNIYDFHNWSLDKKNAVGSFCIVASAVFFLLNR